MLSKRISKIESLVKGMNDTTQEDNVCEYLRLVVSNDSDIERTKKQFEKVNHIIPKLHVIS